ncbi:MAG: 1-acyl-sn-glycerol-3-phosphate acyltransferase [Actinomycetota bacterium]|nr:1-acyl-sn-glycerol-3-phosphate acyltransferase [Actinomycetota bacterium]
MSRGRIGFAYRLAICIIKPLLLLFTRPRRLGQQHLPATGGVIVAVNHISYVDPFVFAHYIYESGRLARFLAKVEVFELPWPLGWIVTNAGQIPVHRTAPDAADALRDAVAALEAGECLAIYPEGTVTKAPDYWPMQARTGVARLALTTGVPVIPVAQWGAQAVFGRDHRPHLVPARRTVVQAGPPVDLSAYQGREQTGEVLREVTDLIMARITEQLAELRGQTPPAEVYVPKPSQRPGASGGWTSAERRSA